MAVLLYFASHVTHAENGSDSTQGTAVGECYGESKSAWLVGLGIEGKATWEQTDKFITSLPHSAETKAQIAEGAAAMRKGHFPGAEDLGADHYALCAKAKSLPNVSPNNIADCLYHLRIMSSFYASMKHGDSKEQALEAMFKASPSATEGAKRLLGFLANRVYNATDINLEHRMAFDRCSGKP